MSIHWTVELDVTFDSENSAYIFGGKFKSKIEDNNFFDFDDKYTSFLYDKNFLKITTQTDMRAVHPDNVYNFFDEIRQLGGVDPVGSFLTYTSEDVDFQAVQYDFDILNGVRLYDTTQIFDNKSEKYSILEKTFRVEKDGQLIEM